MPGDRVAQVIALDGGQPIEIVGATIVFSRRRNGRTEGVAEWLLPHIDSCDVIADNFQRLRLLLRIAPIAA